MGESQDKENEQLRVVEDEDVVRLDAPEMKPLKKEGKVGIAPKSPSGNTRPPEEIAADGAAHQESLIEEELLEMDLGEDDEEFVMPMGWFYLLGIGLLVVVVFMGFQIFLRDEVDVVTPVGGGGSADTPFIESISRKEAEGYYADLEAVVSKFLAAGTIEERAKHIRHPERVIPLMKDYYSKNKLETYTYLKARKFSLVEIDKYPFVALEVATEEKESLAILVQAETGKLLVDWESFVCYNPMTVEEFMEKRPAEAVSFRVYAGVDNFYAYEFSEEEEYLCFRLNFRGSEEHLFGYIRRPGKNGPTDSDKKEFNLQVATKFNDVYKGAGMFTQKPLILSVRFPEGGRGKRSVYIDDLESVRWAYGADPANKKAPTKE